MVRQQAEPFEWVVVGGGIHGTYVARELLESGVSHEELAVLDEHGELLASFRRKARACGMETLRSNYVQHVGPSPFGLERFAEARDREDELVPTQHSQRRPTLALFLDYADYVVDRFDLSTCVREATVTGLDRDGTLVVETDAGAVRTKRVVLAVGQGGRYRRPDWAPDHPRIEHVWDRPTPPAERVDPGEHTVVVGGGITAGQAATTLASAGREVTLWSRHPLQEALREASPEWLNWTHIERELHSLPPGSRARYERVREVRNDGTVPPYLRRELEASAVERRTGEITAVSPTSSGLLVSGEHATAEGVDRLLLATGFDPVYDHSFVERVADALLLARGHRGMPVLDDATLAWERRDGTTSPVFVTGKLAEGTVGPYAGNVPGARRAAERLVDATDRIAAVPA